MWTKLFNTKVASDAGNRLADYFLAARADSGRKKKAQALSQEALINSLLGELDRDVRPLRLGIFRRAKLANTFKWRLLEDGVDAALTDKLTKLLLLQLSQKQVTAGKS